jgi:transposase-like protein
MPTAAPDKLLETYSKKIKPILPLAKRAFGSRIHMTPEHKASREYTQLLVEYYNKGGSLVALANELGVTYAGLRRRVLTADIPAQPSRKKSAMTDTQTQKGIERIKKAKDKSPDAYHDALASEYDKGISLAKVAEALGISSSQPLYWGVHRAKLREQSPLD